MLLTSRTVRYVSFWATKFVTKEITKLTQCTNMLLSLHVKNPAHKKVFIKTKFPPTSNHPISTVLKATPIAKSPHKNILVLLSPVPLSPPVYSQAFSNQAFTRTTLATVTIGLHIGTASGPHFASHLMRSVCRSWQFYIYICF